MVNKFNTVPYLGLASNGNLGDEYLFHLSRKVISPSVQIPGPNHAVKDFLKTVGSRKYLIGGGSLLFSDYLLQGMSRWSRLGIKPYFFGTGSREIDAASSKNEQWKEVLSGAEERMWVRGEITKARLQELDISSQISGDPAFMLNLEYSEPPARNDYIVVSARLITHGKLAQHDADIILNLELFLNELVKEKVRLKFFATAREDEGINSYLAAKYNSGTPYLYTQNWKDLLGGSRMVITSRMHPGIFALALGKPVIFFESRPKYEDSLSFYRGKSLMVSKANGQVIQNAKNFYEEPEYETKQRFHEVQILAKKQELIFSHLLD